MIYNESDIDFSKLENDQRFEELCFDLIQEMDFHSVNWRKGSADSGRDIEAIYYVKNKIIDTYTEKWFFECKYYSGGVPVDAVVSKFAWADVERPQHLVFITNSHFSDATKRWIEDRKELSHYKVHIFDGCNLKKIIMKSQFIIEKYFLNIYNKILYGAIDRWIALDEISGSKTIDYLCENFESYKKTIENNELIFLLYACVLHNRLSYDIYGNQKDVCYDNILNYLIKRKDVCNHLIFDNVYYVNGGVKIVENLTRYKDIYKVNMKIKINQKIKNAIKLILCDNCSDESGIEIILVQERYLSYSLNFIKSGIQELIDKDFYEIRKKLN